MYYNDYAIAGKDEISRDVSYETNKEKYLGSPVSNGKKVGYGAAESGRTNISYRKIQWITR
jgi:hypothetical protein